MPMYLRLFPTFLSFRFNVSCFMLKSLICLDLSLMQGDKYVSICILHAVRPVPSVEDFFPLIIFGSFIKNQVSILVWIYVWIFNSIPLINISVFVPIQCCFY